MAWHERGLTVVTSVASGLIVAAVVKAANSGVADGVVILWFALATVGAGVVAWLTGILIRRRKRSARAFLMTSAFSHKYYLADFVQQVHMALDRHDVDMVLKVPAVDYDADAQYSNLVRIAARSRDYVGGVVIAAEITRLRDDLTAFCRNTKLPVVFTDLEPFDGPEHYPENVVYVGYDTGELGKLAGEWLVRQLRNVDRPHVHIIASCDHSARQIKCKEALDAALPGVTVTTDTKGAFNRSRAYDAVRKHLRDHPDKRLDAVFCTNDEMALGAVDALTPRSRATQTTVVIGVDGVLEATALIDSKRSPLRATVVQDTELLAVKVVGALQKMRQGHAVPKRTILSAEVYEVYEP